MLHKAGFYGRDPQTQQEGYNLASVLLLIARFFAQMGRVDELGSGILNVYKYLKAYSPGKKPQFIEEQLFRTVIPLDDILRQKDGAVNGAVNDAVDPAISSLVKNRLSKELKRIWEKEGSNLRDLMSEFSIERRTAQRDMKLLRIHLLLLFTLLLSVCCLQAQITHRDLLQKFSPIDDIFC